MNPSKIITTYKTKIHGIDQYRFFPRINGSFNIGKYTLLNNNAEVKCYKFPKTVYIGKYCSIGKCYFIVDADHNPNYASTYPFKELFISPDAPFNEKKKNLPIVKNEVWIGDEAYIYSGVTIHDGAIVAGNSVVTKDVPAYAIVAGNPARVVRYRFDNDLIQKFLQVQWWELPDDIVHHKLASYIHEPEVFIEKALHYRTTLNK